MYKLDAEREEIKGTMCIAAIDGWLHSSEAALSVRNVDMKAEARVD
jgi:hypothetical protein